MGMFAETAIIDYHLLENRLLFSVSVSSKQMEVAIFCKFRFPHFYIYTWKTELYTYMLLFPTEIGIPGDFP
jgi:hypothetical protein